jgi:DTW domain-containing protein YfiP
MSFEDPVLLYPSKTATSIFPDSVKTIVLIDATWSFAKSLYNKNPWLSSLPTVVLKPVNEPIYAPLRLPPKPGLVSTAEALILMLEAIGDLESSNALRSALQHAVTVETFQNKAFNSKRKDLEAS